MLKRTFSLFAILFALQAGAVCQIHRSGFVQNTAGVAKDVQAITAIQQSLSAMNGLTAALIDSIAQGTITFSDGTSASMIIKTRGSDKIHHDINFPDLQLSYVISGGQGYRINNGTKEDLPLHVTAYQRVEYLPAFSRMLDYASPVTNATYIGLEKLATGSVIHIVLTDVASNPAFANAASLNSEFHVYIDPTTNRVVQTRSFMFSPTAIENRVAVDTYYSNYQNVSGVLVPFQSTRFVSGQKYSDLQLSAVQIGVALNSDSDFQ